jgi:hypothetical protein
MSSLGFVSKRILFILSLIFLSNIIGAQQPDWKLCPGEEFDGIQQIFLERWYDEYSVWRIELEIHHLTCANKTGKIIITDISQAHWTPTPALFTFVEKFKSIVDFKENFVTLYPASTINRSRTIESVNPLPIVFDKLASNEKFNIQVGYNTYFKGRYTDTESGFFKDIAIKDYFGNPVVETFKKNNRCLLDSDGAIKVDVLNHTKDKIMNWDDGFIGFQKKGLIDGTYNGVLELQAEEHRCCADVSEEITSGFCWYSTCEFNFDDGVIEVPFMFLSSGWTAENGGALAEHNNALWYKIYDGSLIDYKVNVSVEFDYTDAGQFAPSIMESAIVVNSFRASEMRIPFTGSGHQNISFQISDTELHDIGILGHNDDFFDNLKITVDPPLPLIITDKDSIETDTFFLDICAGDTIIPYTHLNVLGGITPYQYAWDTNGDNIFDDHTNYDYSFVSDTTDIQHIHLRITDTLGISRVVTFAISTTEVKDITIDIPELAITDEEVIDLRLCTEDAPFMVTTNPANLTFEPDSILTNGMFSPASGVGQYSILASYNECSNAAFLNISVGGNPDISIPETFDHFLCENDTLDLSRIISGYYPALWGIGDSLLRLEEKSDSLIVLPEGTHRLAYIAGSSSCQVIDSTIVSVIPEVDASLKDTMISLKNNSGPINLDFLFDKMTTEGGQWSGGTYVTTDGIFDPTGLNPGAYPVIYEVGEGKCLRSDTAVINIVLSTATIDRVANTPNAEPNPFEDFIRIKFNYAHEGDVTFSLHSSDGHLVHKSRTPIMNNQIIVKGLGHLGVGTYLARVAVHNQVSKYILIKI